MQQGTKTATTFAAAALGRDGILELYSVCILCVHAGSLAALLQCAGHLVKFVGADLQVQHDMPHTLQVHMSPLCIQARTAMQLPGQTLEEVLRS